MPRPTGRATFATFLGFVMSLQGHGVKVVPARCPGAGGIPHVPGRCPSCGEEVATPIGNIPEHDRGLLFRTGRA